MGEGIRIGGGKNYGLNVWRRGDYSPAYTYTITSAWKSCDNTNYKTTIAISVTGIELSNVTKEMLVGMRLLKWTDDYGEKIVKVISTSQVRATLDGRTMWEVDYSFNNLTGDLIFNTNVNNTSTMQGGSKSVSVAEVFDLKDFIVNDNPTAYPNGGYKNGYYYELYGLPIKMVTWANGTDEEIVAMVEAADQGLINLSDYWAVGDTRTVRLSAMSNTGVGESHAAQQVDLVLMHAGGYDLNAAVASGRNKCSFIVGQKDSLAEEGYMNSSNTNSGSWNGSARRNWCNNVYKNALPSTLLPIFKQFKTITAQKYNGSANQESIDFFALPAEKEIFGSRTYSNETELNALFQFDYYKTTSNRVKKRGKTGSASDWWERSPHYLNSYNFCYVGSNGNAGYDSASYTKGLAPFGCI